eukprot:gnl/Trimastix_PCT/897.p1 GENE.gnl/Trimastix_PCT/897~~gnl/Trimastix_PCT/897.p1  ORF type:complete len:401 (+),score=109.72 gnl/Trimastix_PCT/897:52-1203(+)
MATRTPDQQTEQELTSQAKAFAQSGNAPDIVALMQSSRERLESVSFSRKAKIVRVMIDLIGTVPGAEQLQIETCREWVEICQHQMFLRLKLEILLASLYMGIKDYVAAKDLLEKLLKEVKKNDDKRLLVELHLLESQCHLALRDLPKARTSLTAARAAANAVYVPPTLSSKMEMQSGLLHSEEHDYKTAYSYFYEAFESDDGMKQESAEGRLKYVLMCLVMLNKPDEVTQLTGGRLALKYTGRPTQAMRAVAEAQAARSLHDFQRVLDEYADELQEDPHIASHLQDLRDTLFEGHLARIIEPFSRVEVSHIAELIGLEIGPVEAKLSQMILDKKLHGILDQGTGCLKLFDPTPADKTYEASAESLQKLNRVVDALFEKAAMIN